MRQSFEADLVTGARAHLRSQPGDGFDVVSDNIRFGGDHRVDQIFPRIEVGNQQFDRSIRIFAANGPYRFRPYFGSAVGQIVTRYGSDDTMFQSHQSNGTGEFLRLIRVGR